MDIGRLSKKNIRLAYINVQCVVKEFLFYFVVCSTGSQLVHHYQWFFVGCLCPSVHERHDNQVPRVELLCCFVGRNSSPGIVPVVWIKDLPVAIGIYPVD